ncbi:MAG: hydrogenase maturation protease [Candidatus Heimdallarchaeaceae archaeon]
MKDMQGALSFYKDTKEIENTAFVCLGNTDRSDDAFGVQLAKKLKEFSVLRVYSEEEADPSTILLNLIEDETIKKIVVIDAVDFNAEPGSIIVTSDISNAVRSVTTHNVPLHMWKQVIEEHGKEFVLLGSQVKSIELFGEMSEEIKAKIDEIANLLDPTICLKSCK